MRSWSLRAPRARWRSTRSLQPHRGILAVQSLLEFIAVVRRKRPQSLPSALAKVSAWSAVFETASTTRLVAERAARLSRDHGLQIWDAVIFAAASDAGADILLSEDMHDGFALDGLRISNPFALEKHVLEALLAS